MFLPGMVTSVTSPFSAAAMKSLKMTSGSFVCCLLNKLNSRRNINPSTNHKATFRENWFTIASECLTEIPQKIDCYRNIGSIDQQWPVFPQLDDTPSVCWP